MRIGAALLAFAMCLFASGRVQASRPLAVGEETWTPPAWSELGADQRRAVDRYADSTSYEAARGDSGCTFMRWRYPSDSAQVVALVVRPRAAHTLPAIVYCRGSFVQQGQEATFVPLLHRLARAGYDVIAPMYRGSEGGTGRDEMGGADVEDVLMAIRLMYMPTVNPRPIYLYGESRGGMMVFQALRDSKLVRAAATVGAFTDLDSLFQEDERAAAMATKIWPDYAARAKEIALRRSAARWAERIKVPLLILHGGSDSQVSPRHAERLSAALQVPHELVIVPGGSHTLGERSAYRDSMVTSWFHAHGP